MGGGIASYGKSNAVDKFAISNSVRSAGTALATARGFAGPTYAGNLVATYAISGSTAAGSSRVLTNSIDKYTFSGETTTTLTATLYGIAAAQAASLTTEPGHLI